MKVADLQPKTAVDEITVEVVEKGETRAVKGGSLNVCDFQVKDETGSIKMTLWNNDIERVNVGDSLTIKKGWVNEYQGDVSLSSGRFGSMDITPGSGAPAAAEEVQEAQDEDII